FQTLVQRKLLLLDGHAPWSKESWFCTRYNFRASMLAALVRTYPIIGMTRGEVYEMLGKPDNYDDNDKPDLFCSDTKFYSLVGLHCGNAAADGFELAFKFNRVAAYRVIHWGERW